MPPSVPLSADSTNRVSEAAMLSCAAVVEMLDRQRLLDASSLEEARGLLPRFSDARLLLRELTQRGWLTNFQSRLILQGRANQLVLGPYIVLEKVGEGGMGAVFKAHRTEPDRVVAIKIMRRERSENADLVRRFRREVEVASTLSHPNIVRALDATEVDGSLIFEMEFIAGINLTQLVQKRGPLPVPMAADFTRQAAFGLQHAFEKGLVHRDIKPSNLFVTRNLDSNLNGYEQSPYGVIKLLDLGLALIQPREGERERTRLTQLGKVVGTTDFLAPEQARNAHEVDIRADLYSLGCTFYFLLAGDVPFPDGAPMEKLLKHQLDEPTAIEARRRGLPAGLGDLVRKLMAKKPEDRYQTPGEVAVLLEPFARGEESAPNPTRLDSAAPPELPAVTTTPTPVKTPAVVTRPMPIPLQTSEPVPIALPPLLATDPSVAASKSDSPTRRLRAAVVTRRMPLPDRPARSRGMGMWLIVIAMLLGGLGGAIFLATRNTAAPTSGPADHAKRSPTGYFALDDLNASKIPPDERIAGQPAELVAVLGEHDTRAPFTAAVFAPEGTTLALLRAATPAEPDVGVWDFAAGRFHGLGHFKGTGAMLQFVGDGKQLACFNPTGATFWDITTGRQVVMFRPPNKTDLHGSIFPDGRHALLRFHGGMEVQYHLWDIRKDEELKLIKGSLPRVVRSAPAFTDKGKTLALCADKGDKIRLYDVDSLWEKEPVQDMKPSAATQPVYSADGTLLVMWGGQTIRVLDAANGKEHAAAPIVKSKVQTLSFAPSGHLFAFVTNDGQLTIWDADAARKVRELTFPGPVLSFSFAADGRHLATVNANATVYILRLPRG
jgi:serine/threonine-protein kinase